MRGNRFDCQTVILLTVDTKYVCTVFRSHFDKLKIPNPDFYFRCIAKNLYSYGMVSLPKHYAENEYFIL